MKAIPQIPQLSLDTRVDNVKMAVLRLMVMNNRLYKYLYSSTFDVPDYEKQNILYNNETLYLQYQQYFTFDLNNPDFEFHRRQLDAQILCNRKIHEIVRNTRELYADICSPLYNKRKFITAKVFPNASQLNLPKTLPLTSVCDHLLSVYHYMYDPLIEEVMFSTVDELLESLQISIPTEKLEPAELTEKPLSSNLINIPTQVRSDETTRVSKPTEMPNPVKVSEKSLVSRPAEISSLVQLVESPKTSEPIRKSDPVQSEEAIKISKPTNLPEPVQLVNTSKITEPTETPKPDKLVETSKISKSVQMPKPVQLEQTEISKSIEIPEPVQLVNKSKITEPTETPKSDKLVETSNTSKPIETPKPDKLVETSKISKSVEMPKPIQLEQTEISKSIEIPGPVQLVDRSMISKSVEPVQLVVSRPIETTEPAQLVKASDISKSVEIPTQVQLLETSTISKSAEIPKSVQLAEIATISEPVKESNVTQKHVSEVPATHSNKHKSTGEVAVQNFKTEIKTAKSVTKEVKVAKKRPIKDLADTVTQKRQRDATAEGTELTAFLGSNVKEEMIAKHQRIAQWIQACVPKPTGAKRKASLLNKPRKDHAAKRQKMTKVTPSSSVNKRVETSRKKSKNKKIQK